ncbi:MAG: glycosyltransferase family 39 protein, partial [Myxococcota bacterium]|nr:glycosyltransferase family 39 protein [Myxococcota bacterium]
VALWLEPAKRTELCAWAFPFFYATVMMALEIERRAGTPGLEPGLNDRNPTTTLNKDDVNLGRWRHALLAILVLAFAIRIFALVATSPTPLANDERHYHAQAVEWVAGGELGEARGRPPGIVIFYAALARIFGDSINVPRAGNAILGVVVVWLVAQLGALVGGRRVGLAAAALCAFYPSMIAFSHYLWSEMLYLVFALGALILVLRDRGASTRWRLAAAGFLMGLAALTREVGLVAALALACFLVWDSRESLRRGVLAAATVLVVCGATILPWSIHLHQTTGHVRLVSRTTWTNLYVGNSAPGERHSVMAYRSLGETRTERDVIARKKALRAIAMRMPWWPIEKLVEVRDLFAPTSYFERRLLEPPNSRTALGEPRLWRYHFRWSSLDASLVRRMGALIALASYVAVAVAGVVGLVLMRNASALVGFALFSLSQIGPTLITFASSRFRMPLIPLLLIGAALLMTSGPALWREASGRRRMVALQAGLVMIAILFWGREASRLLIYL